MFARQISSRAQKVDVFDAVYIQKIFTKYTELYSLKTEVSKIHFFIIKM